jgi:hypothetical protein
MKRPFFNCMGYSLSWMVRKRGFRSSAAVASQSVAGRLKKTTVCQDVWCQDWVCPEYKSKALRRYQLALVQSTSSAPHCHTDVKLFLTDLGHTDILRLAIRSFHIQFVAALNLLTLTPQYVWSCEENYVSKRHLQSCLWWRHGSHCPFSVWK